MATKTDNAAAKANARAAPVETGLTLETKRAISAKVRRYHRRTMAGESSDQIGVPAR
jgi:hypothetical protein